MKKAEYLTQAMTDLVGIQLDMDVECDGVIVNKKLNYFLDHLVNELIDVRRMLIDFADANGIELNADQRDFIG